MKTWKTWGVVAASGLLIVLSWITGWDWLMIAAAAIAGGPIAISAVQALRIRMVSIDLLVWAMTFLHKQSGVPPTDSGHYSMENNTRWHALGQPGQCGFRVLPLQPVCPYR